MQQRLIYGGKQMYVGSMCVCVCVCRGGTSVNSLLHSANFPFRYFRHKEERSRELTFCVSLCQHVGSTTRARPTTPSRAARRCIWCSRYAAAAVIRTARQPSENKRHRHSKVWPQPGLCSKTIAAIASKRRRKEEGRARNTTKDAGELGSYGKGKLLAREASYHADDFLLDHR